MSPRKFAARHFPTTAKVSTAEQNLAIGAGKILVPPPQPPFEAQAEASKTYLTFIDQWVCLSHLVWDNPAILER